MLNNVIEPVFDGSALQCTFDLSNIIYGYIFLLFWASFTNGLDSCTAVVDKATLGAVAQLSTWPKQHGTGKIQSPDHLVLMGFRVQECLRPYFYKTTPHLLGLLAINLFTSLFSRLMPT